MTQRDDRRRKAKAGSGRATGRTYAASRASIASSPTSLSYTPPDGPKLKEARRMLARGMEFIENDDYTAALKPLNEALQQFERMEAGPKDLIPTLISLSNVNTSIGNMDRSELYAKRALDLASGKGIDARTKGDANMSYGLSLYYRGDRTRSMEHFDKARALFETAKDKTGLADALRLMGNCNVVTGQYARAIAYYTQALKWSEHLTGARNKVPNILTNIASAKSFQGFFSDAIADYEAVLARCTEPSHTSLKVIIHKNIGDCYVHLGRYDDALSHFEEASGIAKGIGFQQEVRHILIKRAEALLRKGDVEGASQILDGTFKEGMACKAGDLSGDIMLVRALVRREKGDLVRAEDDFALAERFFKDGGVEVAFAEIYIEWAITRVRQGNEKGADELFSKARAIFSRLKLQARIKDLDATIRRHGKR